MYSLFLLLRWYLGKNWDFSVTDVGVSSISATSLFDFWKILGLIPSIFLPRHGTYLNLSLRLGKTSKHSAACPVYEWVLAPPNIWVDTSALPRYMQMHAPYTHTTDISPLPSPFLFFFLFL